MLALTVIPGKSGSPAVTDVPDPQPAPGHLLADGRAPERGIKELAHGQA
ncbi:hypothetical protein FHX82_005130 [Amycolatopsis bartoniae]|uniref:Uncharacterized protein n=1 Tax=Amycolatopsis bartoniae TaxID=941986 RepID=A0A8H9M870_9PSEU|nr:hypothetical protein [Amycolatopsis bartoniae]GHF32372.1 hypothetical protein GCM10017566_01120 [Amycolatopsis bartoniae]